jgi:hypothetical protein
VSISVFGYALGPWINGLVNSSGADTSASIEQHQGLLEMVVRLSACVLLAVGVSACSKHGVDAVKDMRASACAGDPAAFFAHVDRKELVASAIHLAEEKSEEATRRVDPLQQAAFRKGANERIESGVPKVFEDAFREWEDDIKHGSQSDLCRMTVMEASEIENTADVHVRTPTGKDRHWRMARFGDRWLLVRLGD